MRTAWRHRRVGVEVNSDGSSRAALKPFRSSQIAGWELLPHRARTNAGAAHSADRHALPARVRYGHGLQLLLSEHLAPGPGQRHRLSRQVRRLRALGLILM